MLYIGTSGWSYRDWQGLFYPRGVSGAKRLPFYAERYNSVEINATFYRFPSDSNLDAWNRACPKGFALSVKGSRRISHARDLPDASTVAYFFKRITKLMALKTVLWQLPPHRARDLDYLRRLRREMPRDTFIYFNNDYEGHALRNAVDLRDMLGHC